MTPIILKIMQSRDTKSLKKTWECIHAVTSDWCIMLCPDWRVWMWAVFAYTDWGQQIYVPCQPNMDTPEPVWCAGAEGWPL